MSQRAARSTRAQAPVYAEQAAAAGAARNSHSGGGGVGASSASDDESDDGEGGRQRRRSSSRSAAAATAAAVRLAHADPLQLSRDELIAHTRNLLQWRDEDEEEEGGGAAAMSDDNAAAAAESTQLDTRCLASMLLSVPGESVRALYALELAEEGCDEMGGTIDRAMATSEAEEQLVELVRVLRAWNGLAAAAAASASASAGQDDLWSLLRAAHIAPRSLVTFCFLLCGAAHGVRRASAFLGGALYLALVEHAARTGFALSSILQEVVLRRVQTNVRAWARQDARNKEAGIQRRKVRGSNAAASSGADPFGDNDAGGHAGAGEEEAEQAAWMASPTAAAFVADYLAACTRLFGPTAPAASGSAAVSTRPALGLAKHAELHSHLVDTLLDVTRTDVEVSKRGAKSSSADVDSGTSAAAAAGSSPLPAAAFECLLLLLHPAHGAPIHSLQLLLKHVLSSALLSFGPGGSSSGGAGAAASVPRHLLRVHRGAVAFVRRLAAQSALLAPVAEVQRALHHFLQHFLLRAADRADFRKLVTAAVVRDLLSGTGAAEQGGLWGGLRVSTVAFVGRMARNKRPAVRLMAIEVAEAAVQAAWSLAETAAPPSSSAAQAQPPSRRSSFAEKLREADEEEEEGADAQGARGSRASLGASVAGQGAQDQDAPMQLEDDSPAGQARADALPLASQLLALLLGRCSDASPTVRARGLAALAHVLSYCAGAFTSRDDPPGAMVDDRKQKERAVFARVLAGRMAGPLAGTGTATAPPTPSASLSRSRSAPAPAQSPSQAAAGVTGTPLHHSKSFTFMQTPLQATLQATLHSQSQSQGGDLSFTVCDSPGGALGLGFEPMAQQLPAFHPAQAGVRDILAVLYRRSADEKALVRRAALQALECILLGAAAEDPAAAAGADASWTEEPTAVPSTPAAAAALPSSSPSLLACLTASDLQIFYDGCFDRSLSIRKQASASLTALLQRYCSVRWPADAVAAAALGNLQRVWLGAVLPLVHDRERTVADACVAAVRDLLVTPAFACLAAAHGGPTGGRKTSAGALARAAAASAAAEQSRGDSHSVWHLFGAMDGEMLHYFQLVFLQLLRGGAVPPESLRSLLKEIQAQCAAPAEAAAGAEGPVAAEKIEDKKPASSAGGMGTGMLVAAGSASDRARACWVLLECACMASGSASAATGRVDLTGAVHAAWLRITASPGSAPLRLDQASLLRLLSCVGHLSNAGLWGSEQAGSFARVLAATIKAQVRSPAVLASKVTASPGAADVASAELIKKQVWILNSLCAASSSSTSSAAGKKSASGVASGAQLQAGWEAEVLAECEKRLEAFVHAASTATTTAATGSGSGSGTPWNEPALHCVLFTLGEVVLQHQSYHAKTTLPPAALHLVQTFVAPTMRRGQARGGKYAAAAAAEAEAEAAKVKDESMMSDATLSLSLSLPLNESASNPAGEAQAEVMVLPPSLRAHAFLCLGKLCLRNESLAKRSIALLVSELERPLGVASPLVQNNVLLILCDLCRTYTAVVDPYLGSITALLASPNPLLRKHTVLVLNVLLQEEYLKLRGASHATATNVGGGGGAGAGGDDATGALAASAGGQQGSGSSSMLYRYLRCLVDEDESIRQLVQVSLGSVLGSSAPAGTSSAAGAAGPVQATRMHMHFIELVFFLNQCREHPIYNQFGGEATRTGAQGKGGKKGAAAATAAAAVRGSSSDAAFGLVGPLGSVNASKRFVLYRHCLSLLSDEQKFALATKMHQEVLLPVAEDALLTSPWHKGLGVEDVVQDVLIVLASEQMQLGGTGSAAAGKARGGDGVEAVEQELQELALAAEEAGESAGASTAAVAPGSKAAAHSAATAHAQAAAKAKLLHKLLKKTTMESCLPVLLELRTALLRVHSPLHKWLMHLLAALQSRHKAELEELFAGNMLLAREVAYDLRRWGDERAGAAAEEAQRWTRLDFTPRRGAGAALAASPPSSAAAALRAASDAGVMRGAAAGGEADVARRLSMGAAVQSTPLKSSSLSSLRMSGIGEMSTPLRMGSAVAAASPAGFMSPSLRRAASTPMATAAAAAAAALATPSSLRTPGGAAAVMPTPVLLRRMPSTPLPPSGAHARGQLTKRTRRSQGSTTPSQLLAAAAAVSDADSDASTDEDDDAHVIGVVRMPALDSSAAAAPPSVATSSLSSLRLSSGGGAMPTAAPWNVAIRDPNDPESVVTAAPSAKGRKAASNKGKAGAKGKQSVAAITPAPSALPSSSLDQLSAGGKKRKHQSPKQPLKSAADEEAEEEETAAAAAAAVTSTRTRPKRKASGLK